MVTQGHSETQTHANTQWNTNTVEHKHEHTPFQVEEYIALMEKIKIRDGIRLAMAVSAEGNKFFQV